MDSTWGKIIAQLPDAFAVAAKNLTTGKTVKLHDTKRVESASTIKLLVLCCLLDQAQRGERELHETVEVTPADFTPDGSGIMQYVRPTQPMELRMLAALMMSVSDNVATNTIIRLLGKMTINEYAGRIGLRHTRLLVDRIDFESTSEEGFELGQAFHRVIGFDQRFARTDRSRQDLEVHLIGAGFAADVLLPFAQQVDGALLMTKPRVDLPACDEHVYLLGLITHMKMPHAGYGWSARRA